MTAPSEQEVREAIAHELAQGKSSGTTGDGLASELRGLIRDIASPLTNPVFLVEAGDEWDATEPDPGDLWYNLRATEAKRLRELTAAAIEAIAQGCETVIMEGLTATALAFAAEYPDAPRPKVEVAA